jgi:hypothetical protein
MNQQRVERLRLDRIDPLRAKLSLRNEGPWIALLILAAAVIRAPALASVGIWRDEAAVYFYGTAASPGAFIDLIRSLESNPPGFFYLMYLWMHAWGDSPIVMKVPAFFFALVLIWLTFLLGRSLHSTRVGLCAAVTVAVIPLSTFLALEARAYTLAACLCTLIVLLYTQACANPTPRRLLFFALAVAAALYVHYIAIAFVLAVGLVTLARPHLPGTTRLRVLLALVGGILPFAAWLPAFIEQARAGVAEQGHWAARESAQLFVRDLIIFVPGPPVARIMFVAFLALMVILRARAGRIPALPLFAPAIGLLTLAFIAGFYWLEPWYAYPFLPLLVVCAAAITDDAIGLLRLRFGRDPLPAARWMLPLATAFIVMIEAPQNTRVLRTVFSGVPALVEQARSDAEPTLYVLVPDYIASTVVYYRRALGVQSLRFDPFGRQNHPELFRYKQYADVWNAPDLVACAERRYLHVADGSRILAVVAYTDLPDSRSMPMRSKARALLGDLRMHLKELPRLTYPGTVEGLVVYRFRIPPRWSAARSPWRSERQRTFDRRATSVETSTAARRERKPERMNANPAMAERSAAPRLQRRGSPA